MYQTASKTLSITVTNHASGGPITLTGASIGGTTGGGGTFGSAAPIRSRSESAARSRWIGGRAQTIASSVPALVRVSYVSPAPALALNDVTIARANSESGGSFSNRAAVSSSASSSDFVVTGGSCPLLPGGSLGASLSCTYAVTFTPSSETAESGTLSIGVAEDPNGGPAAVALSGTGLTPLKVTPPTISFNTVTQNTTSKPKTVTVTNNGGAAVSLSESVGGSNLADFAVTGGTCGATLAGGGASCTYTITFTPSTTGLESATLAVSAGGDTASPHNVSLSGTGSGGGPGTGTLSDTGSGDGTVVANDGWSGALSG